MNNAEKLLVEQLAPQASLLGFKWIRGREMFVRQEPYGFSAMLWASHSSNLEGGRLEIDPVISVRHERVEGLVNQLGLIFGEDNKRYTTTVSRSLGFFPFQKERDYKQYVRLASASDDIAKSARNMGALLEDEGTQFFQEYSSVLACSIGLNEPIASKTHFLCNNFPRRAYYGIATACIAQGERVPELIDGYLGFAKEVLPNQYEQIAKKIAQIVALAEAA